MYFETFRELNHDKNKTVRARRAARRARRASRVASSTAPRRAAPRRASRGVAWRAARGATRLVELCGSS